MELEHPIDQELRKQLGARVPNKREMSLAIGRSSSWLHKYVNGQGTATIDDLVRIASRMMGVNVPTLSEAEQQLLRAIRAMDATDVRDVVAYAEHRKRLAQRGASITPSAKATHTPPVTVRKVRGTR